MATVRGILRWALHWWQSVYGIAKVTVADALLTNVVTADSLLTSVVIADSFITRVTVADDP